MDELLQSSSPASGDEQPVSHGSMACPHGQDRGGEDCGYAASLGQRKRVAHIPTADAKAAAGSCLKDKGRRDHTLTSAILGPGSGVHFPQPVFSAGMPELNSTARANRTSISRPPTAHWAGPMQTALGSGTHIDWPLSPRQHDRLWANTRPISAVRALNIDTVLADCRQIHRQPCPCTA